MYIGVGFLGEIVAISSPSAVLLDALAIAAPVLAEVTRMGFEPLLRLTYRPVKYPGWRLSHAPWLASLRAAWQSGFEQAICRDFSRGLGRKKDLQKRHRRR